MKCVSIIIPVYNKAQYLKVAMDGLLKQTFTNFEVICVDDASTDGSLQILSEYAKTDSRIKLIENKENLGAAKARNKAIDMAEGEYLLILDADDVYNNKLVELAYQECKSKKLDVLIYNYARFFTDSRVEVKNSVPLTVKRKIGNGNIFCGKDIEKFAFQICSPTPWNKMYRKKYIYEKKLYFQDLTNVNDMYWAEMTLLEAERIGHLDRTLIKYRKGINQLSANNEIKIINMLKAALAIKQRMIKSNLYFSHKKSFFTYALNLMLNFFSHTPENMRGQIYKEIVYMVCELFSDENPSECFLNNHYQYRLQDFMNKQIDEDDFSKVYDGYNYVAQYEKKKLSELIEWIHSKQSKTVLWGYGKNGRGVEGFWSESGYVLDYIVDKNNYDNVTVFAPDVLKEGNYVVLVGSASLVQDVCVEAGKVNQGMSIIDIQSYLVYGFDLQDCIFGK